MYNIRGKERLAKELSLEIIGDITVRVLIIISHLFIWDVKP